MKIVLLSQRVEVVESYGERRDCLDQNWYRFIMDCGYVPAAAPNHAAVAADIFRAMSPAGLIFTGGNDLVAYGGSAPERDETERRLLEYAMAENIPVLGVCRGMQFIHCFFGGVLQKVEGHAAVRHRLHFKGKEVDVNSYHNYGVTKLQHDFFPLASSGDGVIEAMGHRSRAIMGVMWHPEREEKSRERDIELVQNLIEGGCSKTCAGASVLEQRL
ncbi:MAG: gamma-glutamyl-gamma-aminobutyrate hydrolase family protein [Treponema sp.]|jgi:putative glutamine amidotransferase|nr:gamma-glutamyl-gamma-aminobutyrate hydrolase family protein [Treponema sp.]